MSAVGPESNETSYVGLLQKNNLGTTPAFGVKVPIVPSRRLIDVLVEPLFSAGGEGTNRCLHVGDPLAPRQLEPTGSVPTLA